MPQLAPPDFTGGQQTEIERNPQTGGRDTHISVPGGVFHNPAGAYATEMRKWEMDHGPYGFPGRPRWQQGPSPYPCRMYLVKRAETGGGVEVVYSADAGSEAEERNFRSRGYCNGLQEAAEALVEREQAIAQAAAERAFHEKGMSERAKAEAAAADEATGDHLPEVPVTPIRKAGAGKS